MSPEVLRLLQQFDSPMTVGKACFLAFKQTKHFAAPRWIMDAVEAGILLRVKDGFIADKQTVAREPLDNSERIYLLEFVLNDEHREKVGLKPRTTPVAKRKSRTLFDME